MSTVVWGKRELTWAERFKMAPVAKFNLELIPEQPDLSFEKALWAQGLHFVAGIDEAGRGALAGPVSAAAAILPDDPAIAHTLYGVRDSKQMTPIEREDWAGQIRNYAVSYGVGFASSLEIDEIGIVPATRLAITRAIAGLSNILQHVLVDFIDLPELDIPQTPLIKGDARSLSIAAASVLAKVTRDEHMVRLDALHPGYGFARNKGYGTLMHREALQRLGLSPVHRCTFRVRLQGNKALQLQGG